MPDIEHPAVGGNPPLRGFYAIVDNYPDPSLSHEAIASAFVAAGCRILQLRLKNRPSEEVTAAARTLRALIPRDRVFIVNDSVQAALAAEADGVHLGQDDLPVEEARRILGPRRLIGLSTHNLDQVRRANDRPVDYIGFGPIFPTRSKPNPDPPTGADTLREAVALSAHPIVALGGITMENLEAVLQAGPAMVASIAGVVGPGLDPATEAARWVHGIPRTVY
ncbi:MAG: thiamine phosphate synthase [Nitrospirae bacterium]|nr:thiamine phosphate synthase [Nitrospirota bacterium]